MRRLTLTHWILIATLVGAVIGYLDFYVWLGSDLAAVMRPFATIFIRLIKSLVAPSSSPLSSSASRAKETTSARSGGWPSGR